MHITPSSLSDQLVVEPRTQALLDALATKGGPQIHELSIEDARRMLTGVQAGDVTHVAVNIEDRMIPGGPRGQISLRIVRPMNSTATNPAVMYFHGGGWVLGDADTHDRLIREIAMGSNATLIFVNFSRSPEVHYPIANEEAFAATQWVAAHGQEIRIDPARLAVAGDSVGGNMAAAVTLMAKARGGPDIIFQLLFYPVTDSDFGNPSYEQFAVGYNLTRDAMKWFWNNYAPDLAVRNQPTVSPLRSTIDQLTGLPSALIITGECDVLRDEGEAYARKLITAGVQVTAIRCLGTIHDFVMLKPLAETPACRAAIAQANLALRRAFNHHK